jgi:uncharacterized protein YjbI with pentapeptide repeats
VTDSRLKIWIGLCKFLLGTFALGLFGTIINSEIQKRQIEVNRELKTSEIKLKETLQENENLSKYIELALDKDLTRRRDFAKYFQSVSKTDQTRWAAYVRFIEEEMDKNVNKQGDIKNKVSELLTNIRELEAKLPKDTTTSAPKEVLDAIQNAKLELVRAQEELSELRSELRSRSIYTVSKTQPSQRDLIIALSPGLNLKDASLEGQNLSEANLRGRDLQRANLALSNLYRADLSAANLERANLDGADLREANLSESLLSYARLRGSKLQRADLRNSRIDNADLSKSNLDQSHLGDAQLQNALLSNTSAREVHFGYTKLTGTDLTNSDLSNSLFRGTDLSGAILNGANLKGAAELTQSQLDVACGDNKTVLPPGLKIKACR